MDHNPYSVGEELDKSTTARKGQTPEALVRTMQIVAAALMLGVLVFLGIVLVITQGDVSGKPELMTMMAAGFGALMIVSHFVIPAISVKLHLRQAAAELTAKKTDDDKRVRMYGIYQAQLTIGFALLEGAAFFNLIAMSAENSVVSLGVVILLLGLMAVKFPTRDKVSFWVENKLRELQLR